jgi:hypothetical protein
MFMSNKEKITQDKKNLELEAKFWESLVTILPLITTQTIIKGMCKNTIKVYQIQMEAKYQKELADTQRNIYEKLYQIKSPSVEGQGMSNG